MSQADDGLEKLSILQASNSPDGLSFRVLKSQIMNRHLIDQPLGS